MSALRFGEVCAGISAASVASVVMIEGTWTARRETPSGRVLSAYGRTKAEALAALADTAPRMAEILPAAYGLSVIDGGR